MTLDKVDELNVVNDELNAALIAEGSAQPTNVIMVGVLDSTGAATDHLQVDPANALYVNPGALDEATDSVTAIVGAPTPVVETDLLAITEIADGDIAATAEVDVSAILKATFFLDYAADEADTTTVRGTQFIIQGAGSAATDDKWHNLAEFVIPLGTSDTTITDTDDVEAIGQTVIECGAALPAAGQTYLFKHSSTLASSEWVYVIDTDATGGSETFTLLDGLTYAKDAAANIQNMAYRYNVTLDLSTFSRLRLFYSNLGGGTNMDCVARCSWISI